MVQVPGVDVALIFQQQVGLSQSALGGGRVVLGLSR